MFSKRAKMRLQRMKGNNENLIVSEISLILTKTTKNNKYWNDVINKTYFFFN